MKKIVYCLMIYVCFFGVAFAQAAPNVDNQGQQDEQGKSAQSSEETARQKYASDIKKIGISKAVKNALKEGVLSVKDILTIAVAQGINPSNVLTSMSINGVNSNDIIAAKVEGISADVVMTAFTAVEQYKADIAKSDNVDAAVKSAIEGGVLSLDNILEVAVIQGVNPTNVLTAMSNSGVPSNDAIAAADARGIPSDTVEKAYEQGAPIDTQAYTKAKDDEGGPQPGTRGDGQPPATPGDNRGQQPYTPPGNPFNNIPGLPDGTIGGHNGIPEDFIPASPSGPKG